MSLQADREKNWDRISRRLQSSPPDSELRLLVSAAHPDDETIGASMLLSRYPQSSVAFLTDGAPRDTRLWSAGANGSREEYAETRRQEAFRALDYAGVSAHKVFWLGGVDQEAAFEMVPLAERLAKLIHQICPAIVVTHAYEGGHPDHDAAAMIAKIAISWVDEKIQPALLEMTSYHAIDGRCVTGEFIGSASSPEIGFELSRDDRARKRNMMDAYASQRLVLGNFPIDREFLRLAPEYDFGQPPHAGKLWYECMGWPMTGARWRQLAAAAMLGLQEQSCR